MLFAAKNRVGSALALLALFVLAALGGRQALDLPWNLEISARQAEWTLLGIAVVLASDCLVHGGLAAAFGEAYRKRYRAQVEYFRPQRTAQIVAGSLLAGGEELVFRGLLLTWLVTNRDWPAWAAIGVSGLAFGLAHWSGTGLRWPFTIWSAWQGLLLGWLYVASGSLLTVVVVHVVHDLVGFSLFAWQRHQSRAS